MTTNTSFKIPTTFLDNLDNLVSTGFFESRGEAIRTAIEDYITYNYSFIFSKNKKENKQNFDNKIKNEVLV